MVDCPLRPLHRPPLGRAALLLTLAAACDASLEAEDASLHLDGAVPATRDAGGGSSPPDAPAPSDDGSIGDGSIGHGDGGDGDGGARLPPSDARPVIVDGEHTFAEVARGVAAGEWVQYETTAPEGYFVNGDGGHDLTWAGGAAWDTSSQCILHYGGGHLVVPALSIYCVGTNTWVRGPLPDWLDFEGSVWNYTNHGYDKNAFDPATRRLHFYRGRELWTFDLRTETWSRQALTLGNSYLRDFAAFVPGVGVLAGRGEGSAHLIRIDPDEGTATLLTDTPFHTALHTFGVYSPVHDLLLYGGGDDQRTVYVRHRDGTSARVADAPAVLRTVATGVTGGWTTTDPDDGDFLALVAPTGELHRYDPLRDEWRFESRSPFEPGLTRTIAATLPEHGVLLFATRIAATQARITLYRPL